jgi:tetratricopeptide (TPR) repeat protein
VKKSKHIARQPQSGAVTPSAPAPAPASRKRHFVRYAVYALVILAAIGVRYWLAGPSIPLPPLDGLAPALVEEIENARAAIYQSPNRPEKWAAMSLLLAANSYTDEAVACLERAEKLDPVHWKWPYLRAIIQERGDPAASRDALREAAVLAGDDAALPHLLLVERLMEIGEFQEAERHLHIALHHWPDDPRANLDAARLDAAHGEPEKALQALGRAKTMDDVHTRRGANQLAAQLHRALAQSSQAAAALERLKQLPPDQAWPDPYRDELASYRTTRGAYIARINELNRRGDYENYRRAVGESIERYPELGQLVAGRERLAAGDAQGAQTALREAVRLDPSWVDALVSLGEALTLQANHSAAQDAFRRALEIEPTNGEAHLHLGRSLVTQQKHTAALAPLRAAVNFMPTSADAHTVLADALAASGSDDEAKEHRQIAKRLRRNSER